MPNEAPTLFPMVEAPRKMPAGPIIRKAHIEDNYRWSLHRAWGSGPAIAWVGLNPSIANGDRDDPTMLREIGFSFRWGFGSLVKLNLYPFIAADPKAMRVWRELANADHSAREAIVRNAFQAGAHLARCDLVMAAWGNGADETDLGSWIDVVEMELARTITWHCLGTTNDGSPKHTLARGVHRVPDDARPMLWKESTT